MKNKELALRRINEVEPANKIESFVKSSVLRRYSSVTEEQFNRLSYEYVSKYSFKKEIALRAEKYRLFTMLKSKVKMLEVHRYAPELNTLHLGDCTKISAGGKSTIREACLAAVKNNTQLIKAIVS